MFVLTAHQYRKIADGMASQDLVNFDPEELVWDPKLSNLKLEVGSVHDKMSRPVLTSGDNEGSAELLQCIDQLFNDYTYSPDEDGDERRSMDVEAWIGFCKEAGLCGDRLTKEHLETIFHDSVSEEDLGR